MSDENPIQPGKPAHELERVDQLEGMDLQKVHAAILREKDDPQDGLEPVPLWMITLFFVIIFWAGGYLFFYSGGFRADVYDHTQITWGPVQGGPAKTVDPIAVGKRLYTANCSSCHGASGLGQEGVYPPLAGSEYVLSTQGWGENHLAKILLNGLAGPLVVKGKTYNNNMQAWKDQLSDEQIANILTYIRQEWGNNAGPITKEGIAAVRAEVGTRRAPWSEAELRTIPPAALPASAQATP
jgi:mono/diheme cytochrome c family protein